MIKRYHLQQDVNKNINYMNNIYILIKYLNTIKNNKPKNNKVRNNKIKNNKTKNSKTKINKIKNNRIKNKQLWIYLYKMDKIEEYMNF